MSGIGLSELVLLFVIGLLILGPERLPRVASQIGRWVGRARRTANQLRYQLEREIALADIEKESQGKQAKKDRKVEQDQHDRPEESHAPQGETSQADSAPQDDSAPAAEVAEQPLSDADARDETDTVDEEKQA